ncbi:MAG TPA: ATP-binding protein [Opitutaceae bacterium]|nr:ATP-binding protein [Opitutaceae bacterium]
MSCLMRVFEGRIAAKAPEEVDNLKELNLQIIDAMHRTRALTHGLFPGKIQVADIRGALLELASQVKARFKVDIKTQFVGRFPKHSTAQIIQIYRISQEAMSNAIKHGRATEISVRLEAHTDSMELSIKDNGLGFSKNDGASSGVGLNIMSYRASALGGEFNLSSAPNQGATARLTYPFETAG